MALRTKDGVASLSDLVRSALRLRPDRIPIGEVRGAEALDLLKAWGTGHPGGIGTIHSGSALGRHLWRDILGLAKQPAAQLSSVGTLYNGSSQRCRRLGGFAT